MHIVSRSQGLPKNLDTFVIRRNVVHYSSIKSKRVTYNVFASEIYGCINGFDLGYIIGYILWKIVNRFGPNIPSILLVVYTDSYSLYEYLVKFGIIMEKRLIINTIRLKENYKQ